MDEGEDGQGERQAGFTETGGGKLDIFLEGLQKNVFKLVFKHPK